MKLYKTLINYVDSLIEKFNLNNDNNTRNSLRRKCIRELKKINIWDSAKTKTIGRQKTKVFTDNQLNLLYKELEPYLIKRSNIDINAFNSYRENVKNYKENLENMDYTELDEHYFDIPVVTQSDINNLMLEAVFLKFYEPINVKLWNKDIETVTFIDEFDEEQTGSIEVFQAHERLQNPLKSYTKPCEDN